MEERHKSDVKQDFEEYFQVFVLRVKESTKSQ